MRCLPLTILITGFAAFPGARHNPTSDLIAALHRRRTRFARLGIRLELRVLPVVHAGLRPLLAMLTQEIAPEAILHFGLAGRRKSISIETRARNRVSCLHADAKGSSATELRLVRGGASIARARFPTEQTAAALRRAGLTSHLSHDAGDYICNAAFYYSLVAPQKAHVGFIHVPRLARRDRPRSSPDSPRPNLAALVKAAEIAILAAAIAARRSAQPPS